MDFLGIGFAELVFILIVAMMVFGPRRLPEMAAKAGKIVADLRGMSQGLLTEWQRELNAEAYMEEFRKTKDELDAVKKDLSLAGSAVARETSDVAKTIASANPAQAAATNAKAATAEAPSEAGSEAETEAEAVSDAETTPPDPEPDPGTGSAPDAQASSDTATGTGTEESETGAIEEEQPAPEETPPAAMSSASKPGGRPSSKNNSLTDAQTLKTEPAVNE